MSKSLTLTKLVISNSVEKFSIEIWVVVEFVLAVQNDQQTKIFSKFCVSDFFLKYIPLC